MTRSKRLATVKGLEDKKVEGISRALAAARKKLDQQRLQLHKLLQYTEEYQAGSQHGASEHHSVFLERRAFLQRLGEAVAAARERVARCTRDYDQLLASWHKQRGRARALESAGDRLRAESQKRLDRDEQSKSDEVAARTGGSWTDS